MFLKFSSWMLPHHMVAKTLLIWLKITHCTGLIPSKMQYTFQSIICVTFSGDLRVIPCQITQKKEEMKPHLFRFCLNLECGIIRDGDEAISIFSLIGQAVSEIWPI